MVAVRKFWPWLMVLLVLCGVMAVASPAMAVPINYISDLNPEQNETETGGTVIIHVQTHIEVWNENPGFVYRLHTELVVWATDEVVEDWEWTQTCTPFWVGGFAAGGSLNTGPLPDGDYITRGTLYRKQIGQPDSAYVQVDQQETQWYLDTP